MLNSREIFFAIDFWSDSCYYKFAMKLKSKVFLQLLKANGESVSGEELAAEANVSRAAIWKAVTALKQDGCVIDAVPNKGYSLTDAGDVTDGEILSAELGINVIRLADTASTNAYALSLDAKEPLVVIADEQTKGKGRKGTSFPSPKNEGIYLSFLFCPEKEKTDPNFLTACAIKKIAEITNGTAQAYEIFRNGKKIAGVLAETTADPDGVTAAVVGVGIYTADLTQSKHKLIIRIVSALKEIYL